jgi:hypothetical protein
MTVGNEDLIYSREDGEDDDSGSEFQEGRVEDATVSVGSGFNLGRRNYDDDEDDDADADDDDDEESEDGHGSGIELTAPIPFVNGNGTHHFSSSLYLLSHSCLDMLLRATVRKSIRKMGSHDIGRMRSQEPQVGCTYLQMLFIIDHHKK